MADQGGGWARQKWLKEGKPTGQVKWNRSRSLAQTLDPSLAVWQFKLFSHPVVAVLSHAHFCSCSVANSFKCSGSTKLESDFSLALGNTTWGVQAKIIPGNTCSSDYISITKSTILRAWRKKAKAKRKRFNCRTKVQRLFENFCVPCIRALLCLIILTNK